jgi:hypothetical protein
VAPWTNAVSASVARSAASARALGRSPRAAPVPELALLPRDH